MNPKNWPRDFKYATTSIVRDIHPNFFAHILISPNPEDLHKISTCIEKQKIYPHLKIKKLAPPHPLAKDSSRVQRGLFASKKIPIGTELGEYVGELAIGDIKVKNQKGVYTWCFTVNGVLIHVCSANIANEITFVNDFRGIQKEPNVKAQLLIHQGMYYFGYITIRDIQAQEEVLVDYGKAWERSLLKSAAPKSSNN